MDWFGRGMTAVVLFVAAGLAGVGWWVAAGVVLVAVVGTGLVIAAVARGRSPAGPRGEARRGG